MRGYFPAVPFHIVLSLNLDTKGGILDTIFARIVVETPEELQVSRIRCSHKWRCGCSYCGRWNSQILGDLQGSALIQLELIIFLSSPYV